MTKNDTIKLIAVIVMAYPNFDKFKDEDHIKALTSMWAEMFKDDDAGLVGMAVRKHISTSKWPPSIAEIREIMADIQHPDLIPPDLAWAAVTDVMRSEGEFLHRDLYEILPHQIARVVEMIGWQSLWEMHCPYAGNKVDMARLVFLDLYKPAYERARREAMLPPSLSASIKHATLSRSNGGLKQIADAEAARRQHDEKLNNLLSKIEFSKLAE